MNSEDRKNELKKHLFQHQQCFNFNELQKKSSTKSRLVFFYWTTYWTTYWNTCTYQNACKEKKNSVRF